MAARWRVGGLVLALAFLPWLAPAHAEPNFPELTGRVVDDADLLSYPEEVAITADLKALEDKSSDQVVVVTLPSLQGYTIEDFGYQLGRHWGIGTEKLDNGVILIVAPNERKVRIEVGRGLEGVLTDALSKIIIENAILPRFREGNFAGGIKDGVRDVILVLTGDAAEVEQRAKARHDADESMVNWLVVIFWTLIILWIAYSIWSSARLCFACGRSRRRADLPAGPGMGQRLRRQRLERRRRERRRFLRRRRQFRRRRSLRRMVRPHIQPITAQDEADIAEAITRAEAKTSGEIVVVVAIASDGYRSFGLLWAALIALAVPMPLIFATKWAVEYIYLLQLLVFLVLLVLFQLEGLRYALVPKSVRRARAHQRAVEQFIVQNLHTTKGRTGVLIYASFAERFAEVIADEGIYKKVPTSTWEDVVGELTNHLARGTTTEGFIRAVERCGKILAKHFPPGKVDHNELPNHLIVLDAYGRP